MARSEAPPGPATGRPLRLAFVAHPNSIHTRRWASWFAAAGHDVTIVDPVGVAREPGLAAGIAVVEVPKSGRRAGRREVRRTLTELQPDVVHAHYLARFGWSAASAGVHPLVVTPWGSDLLQVRRSQLRTRLWNRLTLRRADLVTVSSDGMRRAAIAAGARAERIRLIHHGVDTERFAPGNVSPGLAARLAADGPVILSPRTVKPLYRHEVVLEAVAALLRRGSVRPTLVISALGADAATLADLRRRAAALGVGERLRVLDSVAHDDLPDLYRAADVVVSVPETDSFAVTLLEAMACGRPLVATDLPAVGPILRGLHPVAADLLVPVGDAERTAAAIERAVTLPAEETGSLGAALRAHVIETAEYGTNMAAMERLYRELVASSQR